MTAKLSVMLDRREYYYCVVAIPRASLSLSCPTHHTYTYAHIHIPGYLVSSP